MAAKKRPTGDELSGLLLEGHFGHNQSDLPMTDPVTTIQMALKLDEIKEYDRNPRREINPAYERIKESIRNQRGLNNPFNITRRPNDDLFMVESGGNTRLRILCELYAETQDEVFNQVQCLFVPWQSESSVLTAHLIENEMRGDMTLIDKAYAVRELKKQLEAERNTTFSRNQFISLTDEIGYKISKRQAIRFDYALKLDQIIPLALRGGLGGHKIDAIKNAEKAYKTFCLDKTDQFEPLFANFMAEQDSEDWDFESVRRSLDHQLAEMIGMPCKQLRLQVDALLFKVTSSGPDLAKVLSENTDRVAKAEKLPAQSAGRSVGERKNEEKAETSDILDINRKEYDAIPLSTVLTENSEAKIPALISSELEKPATLPASHDLKSLRDRASILAGQIAQTVNMENSVLPIHQGVGYIVDLPPTSIIEQEGFAIWWLLLGMSQQMGKDHQHVFDQTQLFNYLQFDDRKALDKTIGAPIDILEAMRCLQDSEAVNDRNFIDCFRLIETIRFIRKEFSEQQLWHTT